MSEEMEKTPAARWAVNGEADPHGDRYDCERAELAMGDLTDDELANAVFMHGNETPRIDDVIAGRAKMPIVYLTAAKDRIRWLSRKLAQANQECNRADLRIRSLESELAAARAGLPEGWKLVPIEPTERMVIEGFESAPSPNPTFTPMDVWDKYEEMSGCEQAAFRAKLCWAAMLAAAPTPNSQETA